MGSIHLAKLLYPSQAQIRYRHVPQSPVSTLIRPLNHPLSAFALTINRLAFLKSQFQFLLRCGNKAGQCSRGRQNQWWSWSQFFNFFNAGSGGAFALPSLLLSPVLWLGVDRGAFGGRCCYPSLCLFTLCRRLVACRYLAAVRSDPSREYSSLLVELLLCRLHHLRSALITPPCGSCIVHPRHSASVGSSERRHYPY
jgi:hypothetical protein